MKKLLTIATLAIALPFGAAYAGVLPGPVYDAGMDDMTMQVVDTNDSKDVMNKIEIPDMDKADMADAKHDKKDVDHDAADAKEEATHDAAEEAKEAAHDATEDAKEAKEDSKDASETVNH